MKLPFKILISFLFLQSLITLTAQSIEVITPNGGERYYIYSTNQAIVWNSDSVDFFKIEYSTDNGTSWKKVADFYPSEYLQWRAPNEPSDSCLIKISDTSNPAISDQSDSLFSLVMYQEYDYLETKNIFMWFGNNGMSSHDPRYNGSGFYWPNGPDVISPSWTSNASHTAIFTSGLNVTGKVNGQIKATGSHFRSGLIPGSILPNGNADDPLKSEYKIFKSMINWQYLPPSTERDRLEYDFIHWPVNIGAPWDDNDNDGIYTPGIDNPEYLGDEIIYYTANDADSAATSFLYGSPPFGLEFQTTYFSYLSDDFLKDVVFKKYKLINKSNDIITDMYIGYWSDNDLGDASDDFIGCDTLLSLGFTYNSTNNDFEYGSPPPAVGHMLVQGPIVAGSPNDSAYYDNKWIHGFKNLPMTSFGPNFKNNPSLPGDPLLGDYSGSIETFNLLRGLKNNGDTLADPVTGKNTVFGLSGDPVSGTGWFEGNGWTGGPSPGDRRYYVNTGPITLAPGDTQEVVYAVLAALGTGNLNSITELKRKAEEIKAFYFGEPITGIKNELSTNIEDYQLLQNFPNPFNPSTIIQYNLPKENLISLKVYDILGREILTLVNKTEPAGKYNVEFDAGNLSSGIYFYTIRAGSYSATRKMMYLK